ncbi:MAG: APC family permease [Hyphomonadaceae bacterium]|nr:APC family permease [Hyphomonadaceae bacterium]
MAQALRRDIGLWSMFTLGFGAMIGVGWIVMLGSWLADAGALGAIIAFAMGGCLMASFAICYGEVSARFPGTGGDIVFVHNVFGGFAAYAIGWLLLFVYASVNGFLSLSAGWIVDEFLGPDHAGIVDRRIIAVAGIFLLCSLNILGSRWAARFQSAATYLLVFAALIFIAAGLWRGSTDNLQPLFSGETDSAHIGGILAVFVTTPLWYAGFNVVPQAMGERAPGVSPRQVASAMLLGILGAAVFYLAILLSGAMALPRAAMMTSDLPASAAFSAALGSDKAGKLVLLAGFMGLLTSWNAVFFAGARVLYTLGVVRFIPSNFSMVSPRFGTPVLALLCVATVSSALVLVGNDGVATLANASGIGFAMLFLSAAVVTLWLRAHPRTGRGKPHLPFSGVAAIIATFAGVFVVGLAIWNTRPTSLSTISPEWLVLAIWALLGLIVWFLMGRTRAQLSHAARQTKLNESAQ